MKLLLTVLYFSVAFLSFSQSLTVSAIGDLMAHDTLQNYALSTDAGYSKLFEDTKKIFLADDLTIANLETPIDDDVPIKGYPQFNAKSAYASAIKAAGIDVVSLANNHAFDQGYDGVKATLESVEKNGLICSGTGLSKKESLTPVIFNVKGMIVGYISGTFSLNGLPYYEKDGSPYINFFPMDNEKKMKEFTDIIRETKKVVDIMIVAYHGGVEYKSTPDPLQEKVLKQMAESGADVVLCHHPHVLQKIEYFTTTDRRNVLIAYSLGNFISSQTGNLNLVKPDYDWVYDSTLIRTAEGVILQFDIVKWDNSYHVTNPRIIPTYNLNFLVKSNNRYYEGYDTVFMDSIFSHKDPADIRFSKNLDNIKKMMAYRFDRIKELIKLPVVSP
jgi:poly-gamma-glutamate capsule biosynthesis protein CapA/YwtB (metallophosphatase superfamily)